MAERTAPDDDRARKRSRPREAPRGGEPAGGGTRMPRGRLRAVIESLDVGIGITDPDGATLILNREGLRIHGFASEAEMIPRVDRYPEEFELRYPDGRPMPFEEWPASRALRGDFVRDYEALLLRRGWPEPRHLRYSVLPVLDRRGRETLRVYVMVDITSLKRAEEDLRRNREDFNRAQAVGQIGSWRLDVGRNVLTWSEENHRIFGVPPGTPLTYETFLERVHPDDRAFVDASWRASLAGAPYEIEHRIVVGAETRWVREKAFLEFDAGGRLLGGFGITQDVTVRKRAELSLRELNDSLEQRVAERTAEVRRHADQVRALARQLVQTEQRERKRLARILHDHVQQLLVGARMRLELLTREGGARQMRAAARGLDDVLREALEASHSLAVDLSPPVLHEGGLIASLTWLASRMGGMNRFRVTVRADNKAEPAADEGRLLLFECARELLLNSLKHSGVREAHVGLRRTREGLVELVVRDAGRGFDPERAGARAPEDLTLGLFGVRERLAQIGGRMEIATAPGKGTAVTLTAPVGVVGARDKERSLEAPAAPRGAGRLRAQRTPCRVLIVDDHKIMREGLRELLDYERDLDVVGEASDGPGAIELAEKLAPDVAIMDVNLGGMSGVEATRRILAAHPRIKVIGLSMHTDAERAAAMRAAGAAAYLTKGGPAEDLIAAIRACTRGVPPKKRGASAPR